MWLVMVIGGLVAERLRTRRTLSTTSVRKLFCAAGTYSLTHLFIYLFIFAFSALTLLVGRQEGHPEWRGAGVVVCLERGADLHMAQLMPRHLLSLASVKSRLVLPFWYRLTWVVTEKGR